MKNIKTKLIFLAVFFLLGAFQASAIDFGVQTQLNDGTSVYIGNGNTPMNSGVGGWGGINNNYGLPGGSILGILQSSLLWLLAIFAVLGIIAFVISGIKYLLAAGDAELAKSAKTNMQWAIIGIIVGLSGFIILTAINAWLAGSTTF